MQEVKPVIISSGDSIDLHKKIAIKYVDAFQHQILELFEIVHTKFIGSSEEEMKKSKEYNIFTKKMEGNFVHVYFPWNQHLVKTVPKSEYLILKTNRNQDLITAEEQLKLRDYSVAVLGLSVGSNIALTMTQAGVSNRIIIADFDNLDPTNLNRIIGGVHQVGLPKVDVAAQKIYEDNPFAEIVTLPEGVTVENLELLLKRGQIDCLIDEIDNIAFKIMLRVLAHKHKLPVVMVTDNGDGIVLHVERYDLGHNKIFGDSINDWKKKDLNSLTKEEAGGIIINNIVGGPQNVDPKMMKSVKRVLNKELVSWSQLGSAALLGGVTATIFVKKIALGEEKQKDIRLFIDPATMKLGSHV